MRYLELLKDLSVDEKRELQKKTSAISLSDMEMFIFPDLIYSLLLANIMSPILWTWREDPWFKNFSKGGMTARINRLKQFIMDHYTFNLDLETWGLTTQEKELERFSDFVDRATLAKSNALFGYEGDKYYFDIDIRRHFGLDKYRTNVIPYWKTETLEAMTAFSQKEGYSTGAGECVSLAALYAAALFVVLDIPLEKIFMMATPLHSQNFINVGTGIITNNRRIVTRNMWFNGTELSGQARRAIEHENITFVTHCSGWIHTIYDEASIDEAIYEEFSKKLRDYLSIKLTPEILGNFLRQDDASRKCFVVRYSHNGKTRYVPLERAFAYEKDVAYKVTDDTREKLLSSIEQEEIIPCPCKEMIVLDDIEQYLRSNPVDITKEEDVARLETQLISECINASAMLKRLVAFCYTVPRLPDISVKSRGTVGNPLEIYPGMTREQIIDRVKSLRETNDYCRMAFYASRDLGEIEELPFLLAAFERNPVCIEESKSLADDELIEKIVLMSDDSIYPGETRLAQPDEVWNFRAGDGLEKSILIVNILKSRHSTEEYTIRISSGCVYVENQGNVICKFDSKKRLKDRVWVI